jgi:hypothetical protein
MDEQKCAYCDQTAVTTFEEKLVCRTHYARLRGISADDAILELRAAAQRVEQLNARNRDAAPES